jgi:hypothetical protein
MAPMKVMKKIAKKKTYQHYSQDELGLLAKWTKKGKEPTEIATLLERDLSSVCRQLKRLEAGEEPQQVGRRRSLEPKQIDHLVSVANQMIEDADCEHQVTSGMLKIGLKLKCSEKTILEALHERGVWFHPFREKPLLTEEDIRDRRQFGKDHSPKPLTFWTKSIKAYLDEKYFTPYLTPAARAHARKMTARGSFRGKKQGLNKGYVKPKKGLKQGFGKKVCVAVAISAKKVLCCYVVKGSWCGAQAKEMYSEHLAPALREENLSAREFLIVEDNDPTGHKSGAAERAKLDAKICCLPFPKHSPDLMPLDFGFWTAVNKRLRAQEKKFPKSYYETRKHFTARVRRTILRMPEKFLTKLVGAMQRRSALVKGAKGRHFEEGS